ncbi:MAG TPA: hypothetical protein VEC99_17625, partial [Clostridia bacterium]|nr:hypothetical protein [Clostridia bacterium]
MNWIYDNLPAGAFDRARLDANSILLKSSLGQQHLADYANLGFVANALELSVDEALATGVSESDLRPVAADAFRLSRVLPRSSDALRVGINLFRLACLAQLGDVGADIARLLKESPWPQLPSDSSDWGERVLSVVIDAWLCLYRKSGWEDLNRVQEGISRLRREQSQFEQAHLRAAPEPTKAAWGLV